MSASHSLEQGPAGGEIGRPEADVFRGVGFLEFPDAVAFAVVFLAFEFDEVGGQVDVVEIVFVRRAAEALAVALGEGLRDARQPGGHRQAGLQRVRDLVFAQRLEKIGRFAGRREAETEIAADRREAGVIEAAPDEMIAERRFRNFQRPADEVGEQGVAVAELERLELGKDRQRHCFFLTMMVQRSRGQPSHQEGSLFIIPAGPVGMTANPQGAKKPGMIVAR